MLTRRKTKSREVVADVLTRARDGEPHHVDSSPRLKPEDSCFSEACRGGQGPVPVLAAAPPAATARPAVTTVCAAFTSRAWSAPQSGPVHGRLSSDKEP